MYDLNRYIKDAHQTSKKDSFKLILVGSEILTIITVWMAIDLIFYKPTWIFLDNVNLMIHEAGHFVFAGFGELIQYMGGTIMQLLVPFLFSIYFVVKRNFFAFSFVLFWIGNNLINISVYIKDAITQELPLIGGRDHDWFYILYKFKLLEYSEGVGSIVNAVGILFVVVGIILMTFSIAISAKNRQAR